MNNSLPIDPVSRDMVRYLTQVQISDRVMAEMEAKWDEETVEKALKAVRAVATGVYLGEACRGAGIAVDHFVQLVRTNHQVGSLYEAAKTTRLEMRKEETSRAGAMAIRKLSNFIENVDVTDPEDSKKIKDLIRASEILIKHADLGRDTASKSAGNITINVAPPPTKADKQRAMARAVGVIDGEFKVVTDESVAM